MKNLMLFSKTLVLFLLFFTKTNIQSQTLQAFYKFNESPPSLQDAYDWSDPNMIYWAYHEKQNGVDILAFDKNTLPIEILGKGATIDAQVNNSIGQWNNNGCLTLNSNTLIGVPLLFSSDQNIFNNSMKYGAIKRAVVSNSGNYEFTVYSSSSLLYEQTAILLNGTTTKQFEWITEEANYGVDYAPFKTIILHELGHLVGLSHRTNYNNTYAVMSEIADANNFLFNLTQLDKDGIATLCAYNDTPVGIEDYINIYSPYSSLTTNHPWLLIESNFVDVDPVPNDPDYIVNWENWKVYVNDGCDEVLIMDRPNSVNIPTLPEGHNWDRDASGYVIGRLERSGTDNDGVHHTGGTEIKIAGVPNTFITSGTLTQSNTVWCGYLEIVGTVTVPAGKTLTIKQNSSIKFLNNASLKVYGTLLMEGGDHRATFDFITKSSDNGIYFYQGSNGTIDNAIIKNAENGVRINKTAVTIKNTDIYNCRLGIRLYWTNNYGFSQIHNNHLHNNSFCGLYVYGSKAKARGNEINNNAVRGAFGGNHSTLYLGESGYYGNNNIHNNDIGIFADYGSYLFLGRQSCTLQGGNNIVDDNTDYNAKVAGYGSVIQAENTYWGSNNQSTILNTFDWGTGNIYYIPWLGSAPSGALAKPSNSPEETIYDTQLSKTNFGTSSSSIVNDKDYNYDPKWTIYQKMLYVRNLIFVEDYKFAREICREVIDEHPDSLLSFWALNMLGVASYEDDPEGFKTYLQKKTSTKAKKNLYGSMELILAGYETTKSTRVLSIDNTMSKYEGTYIEEVGLLQKFMYYLEEEEDKKMARSISEELDKKYPKSVSALEAHILLGDEVKETDKELEPKNTLNKTTNLLPKEYALLGNYPNPFNPSTTIKYALPFNSNVELTIYDLSGKEIKSFIVNSQSSGYSNLVWNGTNNNGTQVTSGVYIYKFKATSLEGIGEVFKKSAKLMLLK